LTTIISALVTVISALVAIVSALATLIALATLVASWLGGSFAEVFYVAGFSAHYALWVCGTNFFYDISAEIGFGAFVVQELIARGSFGEGNGFEHFFVARARAVLIWRIDIFRGRSHGVFIGRKAGYDFTAGRQSYRGGSRWKPLRHVLFAGNLQVGRSHLILETGWISARSFNVVEAKVSATAAGVGGSGNCKHCDKKVFHGFLQKKG
jgi:hypothetical protein